MLCLTGLESELGALSQRLELAEQGSHLCEIRLDGLAHHDESLLNLCRKHALRSVICFRPQRQGGRYAGSESYRLDLLAKIARMGAAYVDVEADISDTELDTLRRDVRGQLILSWHDFEGMPSNLPQRVDEMAARADIIKAAVAVEDAADLAQLHEIAERSEKPTILIGMGFAGLLSRCRYPFFGAPWTYVCADGENQTAPGQLTLAEAQELGLPRFRKATVPLPCRGKACR